MIVKSPFFGTYKPNEVVTITMPATIKIWWIFGYKFNKWGDGVVGNVRSITINKNIELKALYRFSFIFN
jgi:hypothetical protein